jgi:excisionase family DNA binding protein
MDRLALKVAEAAKAAGVSRSTLYERIRRGELQIRKVGRRSVICVDELRRWLGSRPISNPKED